MNTSECFVPPECFATGIPARNTRSARKHSDVSIRERGSAMMTWAPVPEGSEFPIENLPFGVFRLRDDEPRVGVRVGDHVVDLVAAGTRARPHRSPVAQRADGERAWRRGPRPRRRAARRRRTPRPAALARRRAGADAGRGRRLRRLLLVDPPRHEPRPHPASRLASRCCRTGATCPSPTTGGRGRSSSAARR